MILKLQFFLLLFSSNFLFAPKVIIVFGPSCSGKSTLSKKIARNLGQEWLVIDRDDLIEKGSLDPYDLKSFADYINKHIKVTSLVIDTNLYTTEFYNSIQADSKLRVLVFAPLARLIERDDLRNQRLQRAPDRAHRARLFVINNYRYFYNTDNQGFQIGYKQDQKDISTPYEIDLLAYSESAESSVATIETIKKIFSK
jgi:cytidylate kinase